MRESKSVSMYADDKFKSSLRDQGTEERKTQVKLFRLAATDTRERAAAVFSWRLKLELASDQSSVLYEFDHHWTSAVYS